MTFTTDGKEELANWFGGASATAPTHIAFGDGNTAATESDSALDSEIGTRKAISNSVNGKLSQAEASLLTTELNGSTIREVGLLNASTGGTLFERSVNFDIDKTSSFEIKVVFQTRFR